MVQDNNTIALRHELKSIYEEALDFFERNIESTTAPGKLIGGRDERDYFWYSISEAEQKVALVIEDKLIPLMSQIVLAVKKSPLLDEADQRVLITILKKMRAALHFRRYSYKEIEVLHDEGSVIGVRPAIQSDDYPMDGHESRKVFDDSYVIINRIIDQIVPGNSDIPSMIASSQAQAVTKYRQNTAFIMMWMDREHPELDDTRDTIRNVFDSFGIRAIRADDIEHEDVITRRILDEITTSEFLIADLTGARQSVYYEVGYAHALGKRVILFRKKGTPLHFDLAVYNCPEYENLADLRKKLENRLQHLTNKIPNK